MNANVLNNVLHGNILHIANYEAAYRGNFVQSLDLLSDRMEEEKVKSYYIFPKQKDENAPAMGWMRELLARKRITGWLSGNISKDAALIRKVIKKRNISIIHTHFISMRHYLSVRLAAQFTGVRIIMHFHNHSMEAFGIKRRLRRKIYDNCEMIACSESVFQNLLRDYPDNRKYSIDNGVDYSRFDQNKTAGRDEYSLKDNSSVCLIFGFDFYRKGVDLALKALQQLNEKGADYELLISLSKNFEYVENEINNILGDLPDWVHVIKARSDVEALYNLADVFLSPSREEGLPYSVLEAAYFNCTVVTSDISAQVNIDVPYKVVHESESVEALADAVEAALNMKHEKTEHLEDARAYLLKLHDVSRWTEDIIRIYKNEC